MKRLGQRGNYAQLWMCLVVKVKSDAIKNNIALGTWNIQAEDDTSEHWYLGNQWIKVNRMKELNSDNHYIYYCGWEPLRRNGVALIVSKRVWNEELGCNLKNDGMIPVHFQGKPFNITVIQVYDPATNVQEAELEWFYEDL